MTLPPLASQEAWLAARLELLALEKELTRARDRLNEQRRRLPMVEMEKPYVFEGPDGPATLLDLFEGRRQLIIQHFMFDPEWGEGCPTCSCDADSLGDLTHLHARDTTFAAVSRAPSAKIEPCQASASFSATASGSSTPTRRTAGAPTFTTPPTSTSISLPLDAKKAGVELPISAGWGRTGYAITIDMPNP